MRQNFALNMASHVAPMIRECGDEWDGRSLRFLLPDRSAMVDDPEMLFAQNL
jgi:hypothetical protein